MDVMSCGPSPGCKFPHAHNKSKTVRAEKSFKNIRRVFGSFFFNFQDNSETHIPTVAWSGGVCEPCGVFYIAYKRGAFQYMRCPGNGRSRIREDLFIIKIFDPLP